MCRIDETKVEKYLFCGAGGEEETGFKEKNKDPRKRVNDENIFTHIWGATHALTRTKNRKD